MRQDTTLPREEKNRTKKKKETDHQFYRPSAISIRRIGKCEHCSHGNPLYCYLELESTGTGEVVLLRSQLECVSHLHVVEAEAGEKAALHFSDRWP